MVSRQLFLSRNFKACTYFISTTYHGRHANHAVKKMYSITLWSCPFLDNVFIIPTNLQVLNWWTNCSLKFSSSDFLLLLGQHNNKKHSVKWDEDQERERFFFSFTFTSFHLSICFMCFHFFSSSLWILKRFLFFYFQNYNGYAKFISLMKIIARLLF